MLDKHCLLWGLREKVQEFSRSFGGTFIHIPADNRGG